MDPKDPVDRKSRRRRLGRPMVPLEKAAQKLELSMAELQDRLRERGITIVGRGNGARIAAVDFELVSRPMEVIQVRDSPELRALLRERAERLYSMLDFKGQKVVPFRRPKK